MLQKAANGRLYKDVQLEMPFLIAKCQSMSKGGRALSSGSAEVMLVCSEFCIRIYRVKDEIFAGIGRCGKGRIINLMLIIQALMASEMPGRLDRPLTLQSVDDILRVHWDGIVAGFCDAEYGAFIAKIDSILREHEIVRRQVGVGTQSFSLHREGAPLGRATELKLNHAS